MEISSFFTTCQLVFWTEKTQIREMDFSTPFLPFQEDAQILPKKKTLDVPPRLPTTTKMTSNSLPPLEVSALTPHPSEAGIRLFYHLHEGEEEEEEKEEEEE